MEFKILTREAEMQILIIFRGKAGGEINIAHKSRKGSLFCKQMWIIFYGEEQRNNSVCDTDTLSKEGWRRENKY